MTKTTEVWTNQQSAKEEWSVVFTGTAAVGRAAGLATVSGVGEFALSSLGIGLATGSAAVSGVGRATARAVGDADGKATVLGVGFATGVSSAVGLAAGVATVSAVGSESNDGVGLAQGVATVAAVGASTADAVGSAAGVVTATGVGASIADAAGTAAGLATAAGFTSAATVAFTDLAFDGANQASYTFTVAFGAEAADRFIAITAHTESSGTPTPAVTIAGETPDFGQWFKGSGLLGQVGIYVVALPTGTTGDVVVDFGGTQARCAVTVHRITGISSATPSEILTASGTSLGTALTVPAGGVVVAGATGGDVTTCAWTNITEAADGTVDASTTFTAANDFFESGGEITLTPTFASPNANDGAIFAAWNPVIVEAAAGSAAGVATAAAIGTDGSTIIPAVIYDGVQGYMLHTGGPTGAADGAAFSFAWAGTFNSDGSAMTLLDIPGTGPVKITRQSDNTIDFVGGTTGAVFSNSTAAVAASVGFCIVLASCNGSTSHLYVIHAAGLITGTNTPGSATNLDLTADWFFGADGGAAEFLDCDWSLWWAHSSFIDFSDSDNREEFWDTTNDLLRDPGSDGSNPTDGTQPLICHKSPAASHTVNAGSGGDADTAGTFSDGTSPGTYAADFVPANATIALTDTSFNGATAQQYTFSAQDFGAEAADRIIAVCVYTSSSGNFNPTGFITIGGEAATYALWHKSTGGLGQCGIFAVALPTGATGDVVVGNPSGVALARCAITVHRITGIGSATASDSDTAEGAGTLGTTVTVANGGVALAAAAAPQATTCTWADITEAEDAQVETCTFTAAEEVFAVGGDLTFTPTFAATAAGDAAVAATWNPA